MSRRDNERKAPVSKMLRPLTLVMQLGYTMLSPIGMGLLMGYYFDKWFNCSPWGMMFFTVMGILGAYKAAYTSFGKYTKNKGEDEEQENK